MDDVLVFGETKAQHDERLAQVLSRLASSNVTLNKEKCVFGVNEVRFLGRILKGNGIEPDPAKVSAIKNLSAPKSVTKVRSLLGIANHLGRFLPHLAHTTAPMRALLRKDCEWVWGCDQEKSLNDLKELICSAKCMAMYDATLPTVLSADASSFGLGAVLFQAQKTGHRRPIAFASRSLTNTERRYFQIEKEALALTWAAERFDEYIRGLNVVFETDHKPLVSLLGQMAIDDMPPRIQRFRMRLMRYLFSVQYVPGKSLITADTLSRSPVALGDGEKTSNVSDVTAYSKACLLGLETGDNFLLRVKECQMKDDLCKWLHRQCQTGWPRKPTVPSFLIPYWQDRACLNIIDGLLLKGTRLVIPQPLRAEVLRKLHDRHQGIGRCRSVAKGSVWWPGLSTELAQFVNQCDVGAQHAPQRTEPMIATATPSFPWERVGVDLCVIKGQAYLVVVDYLSRYPEVAILPSTQSGVVIERLKSIFARHGIPECVVTDNGPQFVATDFEQFARAYGFRHVTVSPRHPQGNGEVERMVQTIKNLILKSKDPYLALLAYRATPGVLVVSPAEILMGRRLKTRVPMLRRLRNPGQSSPTVAVATDQEVRRRQCRYYNQRHRARPLPKLEVGDRVWMTDLKSKATVLAPTPTPRSYVVRTDDGVDLRRNRRRLNRLPRGRASTETFEFPENEEQPGAAQLVNGTDLNSNRASPNRRPNERGNADISAQASTAQLDGSTGDLNATDVVPRTGDVAHGDSARTLTRYGRVVKKPIRLGIDE